MNAFRIDGPAVVSFSGGRTSGYMLRRILDEGLRPDVHVLFADTGKERAETYAFVHECARQWGVTIEWVKRAHPEGVTPFEHLITERGFVPGVRMRFCTQELKLRPMKQWMLDRGYEHWTNVVGIRADEPMRAARLRAPNRERWDNAIPLFDAGVTEADVLAFWREQLFDLQLKSYEGNCDLCFLKSRGKTVRLMRDRPDLAQWWIDQEERTGTTFRMDRPSYRALMRTDIAQGRLFDDADLADCICHEGTSEVGP